LWNDTRSHKIYIFPPTFVSYALLNNEVTSNDLSNEHWRCKKSAAL